MATQDVDIELQEVRIDMSAENPGPRGRTPVNVSYYIEYSMILLEAIFSEYL